MMISALVARVQFTPEGKFNKFRCTSFLIYLPKATIAVTMKLIILLKFEMITKKRTMKWKTDLPSKAHSGAKVPNHPFSHFFVVGQTAELQSTI